MMLRVMAQGVLTKNGQRRHWLNVRPDNDCAACGPTATVRMATFGSDLTLMACAAHSADAAAALEVLGDERHAAEVAEDRARVSVRNDRDERWER